jgi:hypothetical protein
MKIKIENVVDHGTLASEKVVLSVDEDTNLHYYILADTTFKSESTVSNKLRHMYWFATKLVKAGDIIELYTKVGTASSNDLGNGNHKYILYWDLEGPVWNNDGDAAVLFEARTWDVKKSRGAI